MISHVAVMIFQSQKCGSQTWAIKDQVATPLLSSRIKVIIKHVVESNFFKTSDN